MARKKKVALLAEGVDRNLPAPFGLTLSLLVALLAEGVDRNTLDWFAAIWLYRRPPRGGRG